MLQYNKLGIYVVWYFDKKKFLKAYDRLLLLFPEKGLNLILGVVQ